jgi:hypothetical protein
MLVKVTDLTSLTCMQHTWNHYFHNWWWISYNLHPSSHVHSTLLHRLATASKPNNFNLWRHEGESHYGMQKSSRTTGIQPVCVRCVTVQCCWLLTLHSLRGTWMNEWMNEWMNGYWALVLRHWRENLKYWENNLSQYHFVTTNICRLARDCNGSDMLTTINPTDSTAPSGTRINFGTLYTKVSNNHT